MSSARGAGTGWLRVGRTFATRADKISGLLPFGSTQVFRLHAPNLGAGRQKIQGLARGWGVGPFSPTKGPVFTFPPHVYAIGPLSWFSTKSTLSSFTFPLRKQQLRNRKKIKIPFALKDSFRYDFTQELAAS